MSSSSLTDAGAALRSIETALVILEARLDQGADPPQRPRIMVRV
jgi:hypothetical protein